MEQEPSPESSSRSVAGDGLNGVRLYGFSADYEYLAAPMRSFRGSSLCPWDASPSGILETAEARALAASRNHKEAEKRRRQRINSHLDKLRSLLSCDSKTDKASLLAKVVQRVRELEQQTSELTQLETTPSETDEVTVLSGDGAGSTFKALLCCEDRSDLIPDIIETLKSLRLKTLKAEMVTLGGRIRNVLIVAGDDESPADTVSVHFLQNALKSLLERSNSGILRSKRRRF
ncbi:transcription factor bHLH106-like [Malania oleifera]|uniref:transcription factor bHLH106-like n=1 Tax=Malania oleifera TaxID=397392 RepID=UPI0025ADA50C|nr:transcription factor bHLH106-like [Malania oleifera]